MKKGKKGYIPYFVIRELETIKKEDKMGIPMKDSEAFRKLVGYSKVGKKKMRGRKIFGVDDDIF